MPLGLLTGGPLQMLFGLLLMQGLSLTMWRAFLNQTIPTFNPLRFNLALGNTQNAGQREATDQKSVTSPSPSLLQLLPQLQLNLPLLAQQQQQHVVPVPVQNIQLPISQVPQPVQQYVQPPPPPAQVIVVPQLAYPQQSLRQGAASTHFPVQVEPPEPQLKSHVMKRMLKRPPVTKNPIRPKVLSRMHAGFGPVAFVTPKVPAGHPRIIIPPVVADLDKTYDTTIASVSSPSSTLSVEEMDNITESMTLELTTFLPSTETMTISSDVSDITETVSNSSLILNVTETLSEDFVEFVQNMSSLNSIDSLQSDDIHESDANNIYFKQPHGKESDTRIFNRVCYYILHTENDDGHLMISDIDPFICSHLIVGFARVGENDLLVPSQPDDDPEKYRKLNDLKTQNRNLKVLLSVGDVTGGSFSRMVNTEKGRKRFVNSALDIIDHYNFDGIDIDWEFPSWKDGATDDKINFITLLKDIRDEAKRRFKYDFLITAAVGTPLAIAMASYDIPQLSETIDFVNLISYDFHFYRSDRPYTGHHSPLYPRPLEKGYFITLNAAWAATYWVNKGMPSEKIMLGIATYARSYNLAVPINQGLDVPVTGPGLGGGKLNYTSVCKFLASGATKEFDIHGQVPFAYKDYDWIAYENENSLAVKARWVVKANFGGITTFALNWDDWRGECRSDHRKFPLQKSISHTLELASIRAYQKVAHSPDVTVPNNR